MCVWIWIGACAWAYRISALRHSLVCRSRRCSTSYFVWSEARAHAYASPMDKECANGWSLDGHTLIRTSTRIEQRTAFSSLCAISRRSSLPVSGRRHNSFCSYFVFWFVRFLASAVAVTVVSFLSAPSDYRNRVITLRNGRRCRWHWPKRATAKRAQALRDCLASGHWYICYLISTYETDFLPHQREWISLSLSLFSWTFFVWRSSPMIRCVLVSYSPHIVLSRLSGFLLLERPECACLRAKERFIDPSVSVALFRSFTRESCAVQPATNSSRTSFIRTEEVSHD